VDGDGPAVLVVGQVGDRQLDLTDEAGVESALLHRLASMFVAAVWWSSRGLPGLPVTLQRIADHLVLALPLRRMFRLRSRALDSLTCNQE
jgi:hypothetical protein